jgi:hypothetical protein
MPEYRTLREIAKRMRWSPSKVLRRHKLDEFPLYLDWTARGLIWVTSDALIDEWERRKVQMNQGARLKRPWKWRHKPTYQPYNWRLRYKNETHSETRKQSAGQFEDKTEQTPYARHAHKCPTVCEEPVKLGPTPAQREELGDGFPKVSEMPAASQASKEPCPCGVPSRCLVHNEWPDGARPIYEEPPVKVEIRPELSGAAELPPAKVSKNVRPESCTCGTLTTCIAHD